MTTVSNSTMKLDDTILDLVRALYDQLQTDNTNDDYYKNVIKSCQDILSYLVENDNDNSSIITNHSHLLLTVYEVYIQSLFHCEEYTQVITLVSVMDSNADNSNNNANTTTKTATAASIYAKKKKNATTKTASSTAATCLLKLYDRINTATNDDDTSLEMKIKFFVVYKLYALYRLGQYPAVITAAKAALEEHGNNNSDTTSNAEIWIVILKLLYAQSQYHLGFNDIAMESFVSIYESLRDQKNDNEMLIQLITNSMACMISNSTPYTSTSLTNGTTTKVISFAENMVDPNHASSSSDYPYDLAYNVGTYKLITLLSSSFAATNNNNYSTKQGFISLLRTAIQECQKQLGNDDEEEDDTSMRKELAPFETNLHLFETIYWNPYNTSFSDNASNHTKNIPSSVQSVQKINHSLFGNNNNNESLLKLLLQDPSDSTNTNHKLHITTSFQQRIWYYNRAIAQYRCHLYNDCVVTCQFLYNAISSSKNNKHKKSSLVSTLFSTNDHNDNVKKKKNKNVVPASSSQPDSAVATESSSTSNNSNSVSLVVTNMNDILWWESRLIVLMAYCTQHMNQSKTTTEDIEPATTKTTTTNVSSSIEILKKFVKQIQEIKPEESNALDTTARDHVVAYVQLHIFHLERFVNHDAKNMNNTKIMQDGILLLKDQLPESIRSKAGVRVSLASLYDTIGQSDDANHILQSMDDHQDLVVANMAMSKGNYREAASLYEKIVLNNIKSSRTDDNYNDIVATANWIKALSYCNPEKAKEVWDQFYERYNDYDDMFSDSNDDDDDDDNIGAELEAREIPTRLLKSNRDNYSNNEQQQGERSFKKKKSREAILRQRARKREAYIAALQAKGTSHFNPDKVPDPERWLPKYERSYNRRRRNNNKGIHKGAQGGISDKDAAKLDVVARQQARSAAGAGGTTSGADSAASRSTAHMTVVGGGGLGRKSKTGSNRNTKR